MKKPEYLFGRETFEKLHKCKTYALSEYPCDDYLFRLVDHGFIADCAPCWSDGELNGNELAIVSRTYLEQEEIDKPPAGLRVIRLPKGGLFGADDLGTPVATVITKPTPAAKALISGFLLVPVDMLPYVLSVDMGHRGYGVLVSLGYGAMPSLRDVGVDVGIVRTAK